jgi:hypothetical protein
MPGKIAAVADTQAGPSSTMTRSHCIGALLLVTIGLCGCERQSPLTPTTPTPSAFLTPSTPTPPRDLHELHVIGRVVDDTDIPVAGAKVTQWDSTQALDRHPVALKILLDEGLVDRARTEVSSPRGISSSVSAVGE